MGIAGERELGMLLRTKTVSLLWMAPLVLGLPEPEAGLGRDMVLTLSRVKRGGACETTATAGNKGAEEESGSWQRRQERRAEKQQRWKLSWRKHGEVHRCLCSTEHPGLRILCKGLWEAMLAVLRTVPKFLRTLVSRKVSHPT